MDAMVSCAISFASPSCIPSVLMMDEGSKSTLPSGVGGTAPSAVSSGGALISAAFA